MTDLITSLREALGADAVLDVVSDIAGYRGDLAIPVGGEIVAVIRPRSTAEVATAVKICAALRMGITPRGGGTGLAGGATPAPGWCTVVLSFERMRAIRALDPVGNTVTVEAGCTLGALKEAAAQHNRIFGIDHGGGGSSQIGGNLSTNAGGNNVLRFGMAREQVLGLEVVLADGRVLSELRALRKNNSGYDLKHIFIGAEGTLGLITAAVLRLRPMPVARATALFALDSLDNVLRLFTRAQEALGESMTAFEVMSRAALAHHWRHAAEARRPFGDDPAWTVLMEADSASRYFDLTRAFEDLSEGALNDAIVEDGTVAASEAQRLAFWKMREGLAVAMIEVEGSLKSDQAVPIPAIPEFVIRASQAVTRVAPGCVPAPFGHIGDGNIHFNVLPPPDMAGKDFKARWGDVTRAIEDVAVSLGGTVSAEHGIGLIRREALARMRSAENIGLMQALKTMLDPQGIMNPGKVLP
ncbi:MAG: FAD-binding oxidoreductase [Pseudolabrys sp.]|jgi:FAD/FMN-containing dehydrogenase